MDEWPAWQRWGVWLAGWVLYIGAFWLLFATDNPAARVAALVVMCAGLSVLTYSSRAVLNERMRKIDRRQLRVLLPAIVGYVLLVLYVMPLESSVAAPWLKALVVLSPVVPMLVVAWAAVRYVNRCDELERRQHLEAAGVAVIVVGLVCMTLGFLAAAKLIAVNGALALLMVLPTLCVVYGLACAWSKWRNRAG
jgi:hypothetical protein